MRESSTWSTSNERWATRWVRGMVWGCCLLGVSWILPSPLAAEGCAVEAEILDESRRPVTEATLTVPGTEMRVKTGSEGRACLDGLAAGEHEVLVVAEGYRVERARVRVGSGSRHLRVVLQKPFGEEVVVTAARMERARSEVPLEVDRIGREKIENSVSRTLADAVEWTPGIRVESNCQNCNESKIRMLGLEGAYSQILVDGQPTVSSLALVYGVEQLPARLIDTIEVVKGGGSALYGAGAVGGVINLIPHQPVTTRGAFEGRFANMDGEESTSFSGFYDWSGAERKQALSFYAQTDRVDAFDVDGDGFSEISYRDLETFGARFERYVMDSTARLVAEVNRIAEDRRGGDRLWLPPQEANIAEEILTDRVGGSLSFLHTVSPRLDYRLVGSWAVTERDSYYGVGMDPNAFGTTENPHAVADAQVNHYMDENTVTWGVQFSRDEIDDVQLGRGRVIQEVYENLGLFAQEDRHLGEHVSLLYGVRLDDHSAVSDPILSPRLAMLWSPKPDVSVRASLARGFRPPAVFDEDLHIALLGGGEAQVIRNDPNLREETSTSYLLSGTWLPTLGRKASLALEVALFRTDIDDLFLNVERDDPTTPALEFFKINQGAAEIEGVELNTTFRWGSSVIAELALVEQSARFSEPEPDFGSLEFFRTPERYGMANLQWTTRWADVFVGALYTGSMKAKHFAGFIPEDRLETTPTFLTWDLNLARTVTLGTGDAWPMTIRLGVKNLTDEFQEDLDRGPDRDSSYVYGPRFPRSVFLAAELEF